MHTLPVCKTLTVCEVCVCVCESSPAKVQCSSERPNSAVALGAPRLPLPPRPVMWPHTQGKKSHPLPSCNPPRPTHTHSSEREKKSKKAVCTKRKLGKDKENEDVEFKHCVRGGGWAERRGCVIWCRVHLLTPRLTGAFEQVHVPLLSSLWIIYNPNYLAWPSHLLLELCIHCIPLIPQTSDRRDAL